VKVLVVDDEQLARERMAGLVVELGGHSVVGLAASGTEALRLAAASGAEVVLLDIRMPGMNGLEAARHLAALEAPPAVIFTTAYGEHALAAFEANAVDYLLKPVRRERLAAALEKARRLTRAQLEALRDEAPAGARSHLAARLGERLQLVPVAEVRCFVADQKYVTAYFGDGEALLEESLKDLEQEFGSAFLRAHRNALVARAWIVALEKGADGACRLELDGVAVRPAVSRRHLAGVRQVVKDLQRGERPR